MKGFRAKKVSDIINIPKESFEFSSIEVATEKILLQTDREKIILSDIDEDNEDDCDNDVKDEDIASVDFEKTHACCAAFTVVFLVCLFISEFLLMSVYLVLFNGWSLNSLLI